MENARLPPLTYEGGQARLPPSTCEGGQGKRRMEN